MLTINNSTEGYIQNLEIKGNTLKNIVDRKGAITISSTSEPRLCDFLLTENLQSGKEYTFAIMLKNYSGSRPIKWRCSLADGTSEYPLTQPFTDFSDGLKIWKFKPTKNYVSCALYFDHNAESVSTATVSSILALKGNHIANLPEYFEGIKSVGDKVEGQELYKIPLLCCGKNLFDGIFEVGGLNWNIGGNVDSEVDRIRSKNFIRVKPNTRFAPMTSKITHIFEYDEDFNFILHTNNPHAYVSSENCKYVRLLKMGTTDVNTQVQLEEGTQATQYEPYKEHKLTILSPTQLEKVGDIADRIIEKDGVWGVEKNIATVNKNSNDKFYLVKTMQDVVGFGFDLTERSQGNRLDYVLCNMFAYVNSDDVEQVRIGNSGNSIFIFINKSKLETQDVEGFKKWLQGKTLTFKYATTETQFIPLSNDQQVKLRTFANKTNIQFLTEIEGTIKGEVPKSLGATVNTHTTQIDNLNKELDRVKKLEESTVSTVVIDKGFTVVEETSNGYFEDVKLEGKTLVNSLYNNLKVSGSGHYTTRTSSDRGIEVEVTKEGSIVIIKEGNFKRNTDYTVIYKMKFTYSQQVIATSFKSGSSYSINPVVHRYKDDKYNMYIDKVNTGDNDCTHIVVGCHAGNIPIGTILGAEDIIVIEGDYTQNPPSYFEGVKSVGEGTDKIVVSSVNENLAKNHTFHEETSDNRSIKVDSIYTNELKIYNPFTKVIKAVILNNGSWIRDIEVQPNSICETTLELNEYVRFLNFPKYAWTDTTCNYVLLSKYVVIGSSNLKLDKKQLLYLDSKDNAWKKPVLREWDSVEKHSDGKYYYHKRSGEVVLDGSENWILSSLTQTGNTMCFQFGLSDSAFGVVNSIDKISDKFPSIIHLPSNFNLDVEFISGVSSTSSNTGIRISKSKLSTQDVKGFKKWLQTNPVTVVYQLAQEEVYECTNIDLITYEGETNYLVESGVICPRTTLKVHNNISNVVNLLQKKVSLLEQNVSNYMITQNRLMLVGRYGADRTDFKVDNTLSQQASTDITIDYDLFNLMKNNILVGKQNYSRLKMEEMMDFYVNIGVIDWDLWDELYNLIEEQYNSPVVEEMPLVIK